MVGLSMALTIAVCIGSFVWIYAQVEPFTRDFVDAATVAPTPASQAQEQEQEPEEEEEPANPEENATETPEPVEEEEPEPASGSDEIVPVEDEPEPTPTPADQFEATHRVSSEVTINFRPGPGVNSGAPVGTLAPGTELQYLNESQASQDPESDGDTEWLRFRTQDGLEGWIRQIDVESINAGQ